jgi:mannose-6-phosphate isomerase-like protein (cupin superfamily)
MPPEPVDAFASVAAAIAAQLSNIRATGEMSAAIGHMRRAAEMAVPRKSARTREGRDHAAILAPAIAAARAGPAAGIAVALAAVAARLPWYYHYAPRDGEEDLAERIAFAELIGPDGPLAAPDCRVGFTLVAPETYYPMHAHPAVELYLVVAGHAEWSTLDAARIVPPGGCVLHPTGVAHAMRTFGEPLLALYGWSGDIDTAAFYL